MQANDHGRETGDSYPRTAAPAVLRRVHVVASGLLLLWGAAWAFFAAAASWSERSSPWIGLAAVAVLAALVAGAILRPRLGGIALIVAGLAAAEFFDHTFARLALAAPAVLLGVVHVLVGLMRSPEGDRR